MATTTRVALLQKLSERLGDHFSSTSTTNGSTTTIIDTALKNLPNGADDDGFIGFYARPTQSAQAEVGEIRRVSDYTASSGTLTFQSAFSGAPQSGETYELHRFDPADKHIAIGQALEEVYPDIYLPIIDETLVVDDVLSNSDFETGTFTDWTAVGSPTLSQETTLVFHGAQSAKVVASGADGQLTQSPTVNIEEITNETATFRAAVYATAANATRLRIDFGGGNTIENSEFHSGSDQWEILDVTVGIPDSATQIKVICEVVDGNTGYFDASRLGLDHQFRYTEPTSILDLRYVEFQTSEGREKDNYKPLQRGQRPPPLARIRLEGMALLSQPSTDSGTTEIGEPQTAVISALAEALLWRITARRAAADDRARYIEDEEIARSEANVLLSKPGVRTFLMGAMNSRQLWHEEEDSTGRFLVLDL